MDKLRKLYANALNKYENGYIDEAIDICSKIISLDIKNKAAVNLKGLLLYFKGDLQQASTLWQLNSQINKDEVSIKYLQGIKDDEYRFSSYVLATKLIRKIKIQDALELLIECKESDYNILNVYNSMTECYIKLGKYETAVVCVNKVLKIDRYNKVAIENKKKLIGFGISKKLFNQEKILKKFTVIFFMFVFLGCISIGTKYMLFNNKNIKIIYNKKEKIEQNNIKGRNLVNYKNNTKKYQKEAKVKNQEVIPYETIQKAIENKDFNSLDIYVQKFKNSKLKINDKNIIFKAKEILEKEGAEYFYSQGINSYNKPNCVNKAIDDLKKACNYGKETYFYDDAIFFMGVSYQIKQDIESAIKCFDEYDSKYDNEDYECEVLYRLTILYKNIDLKKAKQYGKKLITKYPNSDYVNSSVKSIVNN